MKSGCFMFSTTVQLPQNKMPSISKIHPTIHLLLFLGGIVSYVPGFFKIIDEILVNAADNRVRTLPFFFALYLMII